MFADHVRANKQTASFDAFMAAMKDEGHGGDGKSVNYSLLVHREHCNLLGNLHGGCSATLLDVVTSHALILTMDSPVVSVSVDLSLQYLKAAAEGTKIMITGRTIKVGKTLAFLSGTIHRYDDPTDVFVTCSHTKFLMKPPTEAALVSKL